MLNSKSKSKTISWSIAVLLKNNNELNKRTYSISCLTSGSAIPSTPFEDTMKPYAMGVSFHEPAAGPSTYGTQI